MEKEKIIEDSSFPSHTTKTKIEGEWWLLTNEEDQKKFFNSITNISSEWYGQSSNGYKFDNYSIEDKWFIIQLINHHQERRIIFFHHNKEKIFMNNFENVINYYFDNKYNQNSINIKWFIIKCKEKNVFYSPNNNISIKFTNIEEDLLHKNIVILKDQVNMNTILTYIKLDNGKFFTINIHYLEKAMCKIKDNSLIFSKLINRKKESIILYSLETMECIH